MSSQEAASLLRTDELEIESDQSSIRVFPRRVVAAVATLTVGTAATFAIWPKQSTSLRGKADSSVSLYDLAANLTNVWETTLPPDFSSGAAAIGDTFGNDTFYSSFSDEEKDAVNNGVAEAVNMEHDPDMLNMLPTMVMSGMMGEGPGDDSMVGALQAFQNHVGGANEADLAEFFQTLLGDLDNGTNDTENGTEENPMTMEALQALEVILGGLTGESRGGGDSKDPMEGLNELLSGVASAGAGGNGGGNPMDDLEGMLMSNLEGGAPEGGEDPMAELNKLLEGVGAPGDEEADAKNPFDDLDALAGGHITQDAIDNNNNNHGA